MKGRLNNEYEKFRSFLIETATSKKGLHGKKRLQAGLTLEVAKKLYDLRNIWGERDFREWQCALRRYRQI